MPTLTIFANFRIDSEERFLRMKDSFSALQGIEATCWVINTRGSHKEVTNAFLQEHLGDKLKLFELESPQGWFYDTKQTLESITTDYVLFWLEDHICQVRPDYLHQIIVEMKETDSDYLEYSWWHFGELARPYNHIEKVDKTYLQAFTLTKDDLKEIEKTYSIFIISMAGIFSNTLFKKIILDTPQFLRQYPKNCPFSFEKGSEHKKWLPIKMAIPKKELFASIDDDHGMPGYSLQTRGLYPIREKRSQVHYNKQRQRENMAKKILPKCLYTPLIRTVILFNKYKKYIMLLRRGQ